MARARRTEDFAIAGLVALVVKAVIETDPGISAAVLREANSAQRGAAEPCTSLRDAGNPSGKSFEAKVVLTIDGLDVDHVVTGTIRSSEA